MRLRQVALVAKDLDAVTRQFREVFELGEPFHDPGVGEFGLRNSVFAIGDTYLEIVSPAREGTTAGRLIEKRGGDGGYMVIFQTERELEEERERMRELGVRVVWSVDHGDAATIHLHPKDLGGAIVSLDEMHPAHSWKWAGDGWEKRSRTQVLSGLAGAEVQSEDAKAMAEKWAKVLDAKVSAKDGQYQVNVGDGHVRFVPVRDGRGEGVRGFAFRAKDKARALANAKKAGLSTTGDTIKLAGLDIYLV